MADRLPSDDVVLSTVNRWREQSGLPPLQDLTPIIVAGDLTGPQFKRSPRYWATNGTLVAGGAGVRSIQGVRAVEGIVTIDRFYCDVDTAGDEIILVLDRKSTALAYNQSAICFILNGNRPNGVNTEVAACRRMSQNNAVSPAGDIFWRQTAPIDMDWQDRPVVLFPDDRLYVEPLNNNRGTTFSFAGREYEV